MRLIDAGVLKQQINNTSSHWLCEWDTLGILAVIDEQPTIDNRDCFCSRCGAKMMEEKKMLNRVILMGRLCADPEFRQTQSGIAVCRIRIAVNRPYKKEQEQQADFINCTAWRGTAEFVSRYFNKGDMILVEGQLRNNDYTDNNGVKHYGMDVLIDNVSFCGSKNDSSASQSANNAQTGQTIHENRNTPQNENMSELEGYDEILSDGVPPF